MQNLTSLCLSALENAAAQNTTSSAPIERLPLAESIDSVHEAVSSFHRELLLHTPCPVSAATALRQQRLAALQSHFQLGLKPPSTLPVSPIVHEAAHSLPRHVHTSTAVTTPALPASTLSPPPPFAELEHVFTKHVRRTMNPPLDVETDPAPDSSDTDSDSNHSMDAITSCLAASSVDHTPSLMWRAVVEKPLRV